MQTAVQSGGHSSRPLPGPALLQQLKSSGDIIENKHAGGGKGRKCERGDRNIDHGKSERSSKLANNGTKLVKQEHAMKCDVTLNFLDKDGGLVDLSGVDQLVYLMKNDKNDGVRKPADVAERRAILAGVIAATDRHDCLNWFVQLGGLPILDEWLQEAHKGKPGENGTLLEGDRGLDLLLALLCALERLPVDLVALKTCIVGKSVNTLRLHKNLEIQRRARMLVDVWKKLVDAEMGGSRPGSTQGMLWPGKQFTSDPINSSFSKGGGVSDAQQKCSGIFGNSVNNSKELDLPCSNSGQAIVNGLVSPNGQLRGVNSRWRDEGSSMPPPTSMHGKSSISGSCSYSISGKSIAGASQTANFKETGTGKPPICSRTVIAEKAENAVAGSDKGPAEGNSMNTSNNHRLILRIPNPGRSSACDVRAGPSGELPATSSRCSSSNMLNKHVNLCLSDVASDRSKTQTPGSSPRQITELKISSGTEKEKSPDLSNIGDSGNCEEGECGLHRSDNWNKAEALTVCCTRDTVHVNSWESCTADPGEAMQSQALPGVSDESAHGRSHVSCLDLATAGINLLASVAANEGAINDDQSDSSVVSERFCALEPSNAVLEGDITCIENVQTDETGRSEGPMATRECFCDELQGRSSPTEIQPESEMEADAVLLCTGEVRANCASMASKSPTHEVLKRDHCSIPTAGECIYNENGVVDTQEQNSRVAELGQALGSLKEHFSQNEGNARAADLRETMGRTKEHAGAALRFAEQDAPEVARSVSQVIEQQMVSYQRICSEKEIFDINLVDSHKAAKRRDGDGSLMEHPLKSTDISDDHNLEEEAYKPLNIEKANLSLGKSRNLDPVAENYEVNNDEEERASAQSNASSPLQATSMSSQPANVTAIPSQHILKPVPYNSQFGGCTGSEQTVEVSDPVAKGGVFTERHDFDLNEGFIEEVTLSDPTYVFTSSKSMSGFSSGALATPIAVVATTKGPFIPPAIPLRAKGELGWKGSAATSAFRPAEPRHTHERQLSIADNIGSDADSGTSVKHSRPLDFDLNIVDERGIEDDARGAMTPATHGLLVGGVTLNPCVSSSHASCPSSFSSLSTSGELKSYSTMTGRLIFDLNCVDGIEDGTAILSSDAKVVEGAGIQICDSRSSSLRDTSTVLDFDLNDGLSAEDANESMLPLGSTTFTGNIAQLPVSGLRINREVVNVNPHEPLYPVATAPPFLSSVPNASPAFLDARATPFHCDIYGPGMTFSSASVLYPTQPVTYPYVGFPFGPDNTTFPAVSAPFMNSSGPPPFQTVPSQRLGSLALRTSHVSPPYLMGVTEESISSVDCVWSRPNLDLNVGPDIAEADSMDDRAYVRQPSLLGGLEVPRRVYHQVEAGELLKRKEPEGGWSMQRSVSKQQTWW